RRPPRGRRKGIVPTLLAMVAPGGRFDPVCGRAPVGPVQGAAEAADHRGLSATSLVKTSWTEKRGTARESRPSVPGTSVHVSAVAGARHLRLVLVLGLLHDGALRREDEAGDRRGVLHRRARDLRGVEDACL